MVFFTNGWHSPFNPIEAKFLIVDTAFIEP